MGGALLDGAYEPAALLWITLGACCVLAGLAISPDRPSWPRLTLFVALLAALYMAVSRPGGIYGSGLPLHASRLLTDGAAVLALLFVVLSRHRGRAVVWFALIAVVAVAGDVLMVESSRTPAIDVWYMYQAAGRSLLHGHNFYVTHWTSGIPYEVSNEFTYLPASALLLAPFEWIFGDVRFGLIAALVVAAVAVCALGKGANRWMVGLLVLLYPKTSFAVEQSWTDAGLIALLALMVLAVRRNRPTAAVIAFVLLLSFKQYAWLLLPAAACWPEFGWRRALTSALGAVALCLPWFIADPHAFWRGVVSYNLDLAPRPDSLSWYSVLLRRGLDPGYGLIAGLTLLAMVSGCLMVRRHPSTFPVAAAVVLLAFDLANKQTFFNQWQWLAATLVLGLAVSTTWRDRATVTGTIESRVVPML